MHEIRCQKTECQKEHKGKDYRKSKEAGQKGCESSLWQKGMGIVNDPKKAAYNAVYSRTTVGVSDVMKMHHPETDTHPHPMTHLLQ